MGTIYISATQQLNIMTSWCQGPNGIRVHLTKSGDYVYGNGTPVRDKKHFAFMPICDRDIALAWFDKKYGNVKTAPDTGETLGEPIALPTEPDLDDEAEEVPDVIEKPEDE